jgi:photosystem II stability/assembly factor-like uncharacterized protein
MKTRVSGRTSLFTVIHMIGMLATLGLSDSHAHTPHDVIRDFEVSPFYQADRTIFAIVSDRVLRSTNSGYSWKQISRGLDNEYPFSSIAISPSFSSDSTLYISSEGGGVYKSIDGGLSWHHVTPTLTHLNVGLMAISPAYSIDHTLFAAGTEGGIYRTTDGGETWRQILDDDIKITAIAFSSMMDDKYIFIGEEKGGVYVSNNYGDTWELLFRLLNKEPVTSLAVSPDLSDNIAVFAGTNKSGVVKYIATRGSGITINNGLLGTALQTPEPITSIALSPHFRTDSTIFVSTWYSGVFRSEDNGETWGKYSNGLTTNRQADTVQFKSPHFSQLRISRSFPEDRTIFLAGYDGLFTSADAGNQWVELKTLSDNIIMALAISPLSKNTSTMAMSTLLDGAYVSHAQEATWRKINRGLHDSHLLDIAFSPNFASDGTIFTVSNSAFYKTTIQHGSWTQIKLGYHGWRRSLSAALSRIGLPKLFFLRQSERVPLFPVRITVSPDYGSDETIYIGTRYQGIFRSVNAGLAWSQSLSVLHRRVSALVVSPDFRSDNTLYAGVDREGIYKTIDRGQTWQSIYTDHHDNILLAISPHYKDDGTLFATTSRGLEKTTNRGKSWEKVNCQGLGERPLYESIAMSKTEMNDELIMVSLKGRGLFRFDDKKVWTASCDHLSDNNYAVKKIIFAPSIDSSRQIYLLTDDEIFTSMDNGKTCKAIETLRR